MTGEGAVEFLGVRFTAAEAGEILAWVEAAARGERFQYLVTPNVDHVVMLSEPGAEPWRQAYREAVENADMRVNDSRILQRLARISGQRLPVTPGSDIVRELVTRRRSVGGAVALIGGNAKEAEWLAGAMPAASIVHFEPPMGVRDNSDAQETIAAFVEGARADLVFFAIGAPQSEIVCRKIATRGRARGVGLCIGASVEFLSGAKRRAPMWMQRAGMEWLFRLVSEPGRLWHRYLVRGPRVFGLWWKSAFPPR